MPPPPPFGSRVVRAFALGLPGVAALPLLVDPPPGVPAAALAVNPAILLVLAALAGAFAAPRAGLRSSLILGTPRRPRVRLATLALGAALGLAIALADHALAPFWRGPVPPPATLVEGVSPRALVFGLLYGGLTEEILMRWGLLSLLLLGLRRLLPAPIAGTAAVALAAAAFAAGHLPAVLLSGVEPSTGVLLRTLGWNGLLGLVFGAAFLRGDLETAAALHAGFHLGLPLAAALTS